LVVPGSCIAIKRRSKEIEFFHPGQEKLGCVLIIEFIVYAICLGTFYYSQTTTFESYTAEMMAFYVFFAGLHLILLLLQNTLSVVESKNKPGSHHGVGCVKLCPVIIFSVIFIALACLQVYIVYLQIMQIDYWTSYNAFFFVHSVATVRFFDWILYGCAAVVQLIKICNFISHRNGHSSFEKGSKNHRLFSVIGLFVAFGSLLLIALNMYLITYYEHVGGAIILAYEAIQTFIMLPLIHLMIINQEA